MTRGIKRRIVVYGAIVGIFLLGGAAWLHHSRVEQAYANAALLHGVAEVQRCGTILRLLEEDRLDTARQILEMRLASSASYAIDMHTKGARLYPGIYPSLRESLERVADHARARGKPAVADQIQALIAAFDES